MKLIQQGRLCPGFTAAKKTEKYTDLYQSRGWRRPVFKNLSLFVCMEATWLCTHRAQCFSQLIMAMYKWICVCVCVFVCTCGLLRVVTHEAEPAFLFLAVSKQVEETHVFQLDLKTVQILREQRQKQMKSLCITNNI